MGDNELASVIAFWPTQATTPLAFNIVEGSVDTEFLWAGYKKPAEEEVDESNPLHKLYTKTHNWLNALFKPPDSNGCRWADRKKMYEFFYDINNRSHYACQAWITGDEDWRKALPKVYELLVLRYTAGLALPDQSFDDTVRQLATCQSAHLFHIVPPYHGRLEECERSKERYQVERDHFRSALHGLRKTRKRIAKKRYPNTKHLRKLEKAEGLIRDADDLLDELQKSGKAD